MTIAARTNAMKKELYSIVGAVSESRANYWASFVVDGSCPVLFAYLGFRHPHSWPAELASFLVGAVLFSLVEYAIHRWLLHNPKSPLSILHTAHHLNPEKPAAFLFPTSLLVLLLVWFLLFWAHFPTGSFLLCGFSAAYFYFGVLHHVEHTLRIRQMPFRWLQSRWAAHSVHHHLTETNFGVITSGWDYVFGTHQRQKKLRMEKLR